MASESKAKVIERNRAPRVQIAYDVEHYGSPTTIELPFVMGVMADLGRKSETKEAMKPVNDRTFVDGRCRPLRQDSWRLWAPPGKGPRAKPPAGKEGATDEEMFVDLTFKSMSDFTPDKVAEQVPALAELLKMRRQLEELLGYMDGKVNAEKRIAQLLQNEPLLQQVAEEAAKKEG